MNRRSMGLMFKPDLHQAIIAGHKTQTRRMVPFKDIRFDHDEVSGLPINAHVGPSPFRRYNVGDELYVKEQLQRCGGGSVYASDQAFAPVEWRWKRDWLSPMHMPREAARTRMVLTENVRFERVSAITDADALAEGVRPLSKEWQRENPVVKYAFMDQGDMSSVPWSDMRRSPRLAFLDRWAAIHGEWTLKPPVVWVAVFTFKIVPKPRIFFLNEQHELPRPLP